MRDTPDGTFVPPPGAMQFQFIRYTNMKPIPEGHRDLENYLWVKPIKRTNYSHSCGCDPIFLVLDMSHFPRDDPYFAERQRIFETGRACVCLCKGRIIE